MTVEAHHGNGGGKKGHTGPSPPGGDETPGKPKIMKTRRIRARNQNKVRVHLPPIESYQKELEFPAEGPGRVVVRLERLMGSDRVKITDTKYMATLLERLEEQEREAWTKRRLGRIKAERNRFRQLAIDGLMEPGPDMQDLHSHPVFRVNRVLNRLAKMDTTAAAPSSQFKLPPIIPVDPFEHDINGREFQNYPGHQRTNLDEVSTINSSRADLYEELMGRVPSPSKQSGKAVTLEYDEESKKGSVKLNKRSVTSDKLKKGSVTSDKSRQGSILSKEPSVVSLNLKPRSNVATRQTRNLRASEVETMTLTEMQNEYGVVPKRDLHKDWQPFTSSLVELVFQEDDQKIDHLYKLAEDVLGVYQREQETADDFTNKLGRLL